jgi:hypothetical protein
MPRDLTVGMVALELLTLSTVVLGGVWADPGDVTTSWGWKTSAATRDLATGNHEGPHHCAEPTFENEQC